jgi:hypothetical protein
MQASRNCFQEARARRAREREASARASQGHEEGLGQRRPCEGSAPEELEDSRQRRDDEGEEDSETESDSGAEYVVSTR